MAASPSADMPTLASEKAGRSWTQTTSTESFKSAAAGADWSKTPGFGVVLTDQAGKASWPITGATFILMHKSEANAANAKEVLKFFDWSYKNGNGMAVDLDYVPLPAPVIKMVQDSWKANIKDSSGKAVW